jgi:small subunit ribosomal protein S8
MITDPIGDFIIRLKNASMAGLSTVTLPYSKMKMSIAEVLKNGGFIADVEKHGKAVRKSIIVTLAKHSDGAARISGVKRVSKPGRRMYVASKNIHAVKYGKGLLVVSTPNGIMSGGDARKANVGGEALFEIF